MNDLLEVYNPATSESLSEEARNRMQHLTVADVEALAKAYPNGPTSNNYLVLLDKAKPLEQQLFQLSSWQNLNDLWKVNQTHFVAYGFRSHLHKKATAANAPVAIPSPAAAVKTTVDLSEIESRQAPGLKTDSDIKTGKLTAEHIPVAPEKVDGSDSIPVTDPEIGSTDPAKQIINKKGNQKS